MVVYRISNPIFRTMFPVNILEISQDFDSAKSLGYSETGCSQTLFLNNSSTSNLEPANEWGKGSSLLLTLINIVLLFTCMFLVFQLYF